MSDDITSIPQLSLDEVKLHCRIDDDLEDSLLVAYSEAALEVCQMYIGKRFGDGLAFTPAVKVGCLMYVALLYSQREVVSGGAMLEVPMTVAALWKPYRDAGVY